MNGPKTEVFQLRVSKDFIEKLDELRRKQPDVPTRAEMVRRLIGKAFAESGVADGNSGVDVVRNGHDTVRS